MDHVKHCHYNKLMMNNCHPHNFQNPSKLTNTGEEIAIEYYLYNIVQQFLYNYQKLMADIPNTGSF